MQLTIPALQDINMIDVNYLDPETNIHAGTKYLKYLYTKTNNLDTAIRAYNVGLTKALDSQYAGIEYLKKVKDLAKQYE